MDPGILSEDSRSASASGPCLTLAEVPTLDEDSGNVIYEIVKIFAPPVLHERETVPWQIDVMYPKSPS